MDSMMKILLLSYYDLPSHLKTCLLYLSLFPEDYVIEKDRLIWRWVAEGFVQGQQARDRSFLEIGESYFNELLNRSLIQATYEDAEGTPEACRVHDTVLDLIISLSIEECFMTTISGDAKLFLGSKQEVRRLSLHSYIAWPTVNMPKMRSLTIFEPADVVVGSMPSLSSYHLLRVLDLRGYKCEELASMGFIGNLSHLRYLGLSTSCRHDATDRLPEEVGKLHFLQTLDVSKTVVKEVPSSIIAGLAKLMCLRGGCDPFWNTSLPNGLKDLTSLEVLESAAVESELIAKELGYLTRLRVLDVMVRIPHYQMGMIGGDDDESSTACTNALVESMGKLKEIESLRISSIFNLLCFDGSMEEPLGNLRRLHISVARVVPTWIEAALLPGLMYLNIYVHHEQKADIQVLGMLPCLRHLRLQVMIEHEEKPVKRCAVRPGAFPCLVRCTLFVHGVVPSMFPRGAMLNLEDFTFNIELEQLWGGGESTTIHDLALGHLPSLRTVTVSSICGFRDEEARKDKVKIVKEMLEHEAAVHPNHPVHLHYCGEMPPPMPPLPPIP